jgi:hypothetical protein
MPITDAFFLIMESRRTPMHVGGVNLFTLPKDVDDASFLGNLGEILRYDGELRRPFGEKLKTGPLGIAGNIWWEDDEELDMEYHVRHSLKACAIASSPPTSRRTTAPLMALVPCT